MSGPTVDGLRGIYPRVNDVVEGAVADAPIGTDDGKDTSAWRPQ